MNIPQSLQKCIIRLGETESGMVSWDNRLYFFFLAFKKITHFLNECHISSLFLCKDYFEMPKLLIISPVSILNQKIQSILGSKFNYLDFCQITS